MIDKLTALFKRFPGIGPRQAKRFVFFLLRQDEQFLRDLADAILKLKQEIKQCEGCYRFFARQKNGMCEICRAGDSSTLMIVEKDIDLENINRAGAYTGLYFVLGGLVPILEKEPEKRVRAQELLKRIKEIKNLKEIIVALSASPDGDNTVSYLKEFIKIQLPTSNLQLTTFGRGLSTGSELEYSDQDTIKNALKNRS